ncbi:DUF6174 domain-containing protein [Streptomyces regalis]|uniref:Uncharacterized protein n=1 Tax=Streptomyces regalis TaxID=68262 RepID=A0A0X3VDB5_9ACTN|nr:DUF6174 domain-containing protein [Streptomyces regalis]KUL41306.1 hypothetical protein ADL12_11380 [Streptomyces regalis]
MLCAVAACDTETSTAPASARATWQEPASYTYTLRSSEGERSLLGSFRITVRDGAVAEAEYAADGHPVRISLDWEESAIDDEALYVISAYEPTDGRRAGG